MNAKHTAGPWYRDIEGKRAEFIRAHGDELPGTMAIARICARGGWSESDANARLIATAPEMLTALQVALRHARDAMPATDRAEFDAGRRGPEWMLLARTVIAKATETAR